MNNNLENIRISIITVVYNRKEGLEKTIKSVVSQTYKNIDFIIIDGGSTDGTVDIIKKYSDKISYWVSEKDTGIYDAMNKGLSNAKGQYVWFINAGDEIFSDKTLEIIFKNNIEADAYYGDVEYMDDTGNSLGKRTLKKPPETLSWKNFINGMIVSHQSIIMNKEKAAKYDLRYSYCADIDWAIRSFKNCNKVINTKLTLSKFLMGGYSKKNIIKSNKERYNILKKHFPIIKVWLYQIKLAGQFIKYYFTNKKKLY